MKRLISVLTAAAVCILSPGLGAYGAFAANIAAVSRGAALPAGGSQAGAFAVSGTQGSLKLAPLSGASLTSALPALRSPEARTKIAAHTPSAGLAVPAPLPPAGLSVQAQGPVSRTVLPAPASIVSRRTAPAASRVGEIRKDLEKDSAGTRASLSLSRFFDGFRKTDGSVNAVRGRESRKKTLLSRDRTHTAAEDDAGVPRPAGPQRKLSRTLKLGIVGGALSLALSIGIPMVAGAMGWDFHSNYHSPGLPAQPALFDMARLLFGAAVMAPISEEVIFRAGILGGLMAVAGKIAKHPVVREWIPAVLSAVIFAAVHETADPVLLGSRIIADLVFARIYQKDGVTATMILHGIHNGFLVTGSIAAAMLGPAGGSLSFLLSGLALCAATMWAQRGLRSEKPDVDAGRLAPYRMTPRMAGILAAVLLLGVTVFSISGLANILWGGAAAALVFYGLFRKKQPQNPPASGS